jgi:hypothetical protein
MSSKDLLFLICIYPVFLLAIYVYVCHEYKSFLIELNFNKI